MAVKLPTLENNLDECRKVLMRIVRDDGFLPGDKIAATNTLIRLRDSEKKQTKEKPSSLSALQPVQTKRQVSLQSLRIVGRSG